MLPALLPALLPVACVHCPACCPEPRLVMPRLLSEPLLPLLLLPSLPPPLQLRQALLSEPPPLDGRGSTHRPRPRSTHHPLLRPRSALPTLAPSEPQRRLRLPRLPGVQPRPSRVPQRLDDQP